MIRKYHNHKPQTTLWYREEEPLNHHGTPGRQIKQSIFIARQEISRNIKPSPFLIICQYLQQSSCQTLDIPKMSVRIDCSAPKRMPTSLTMLHMSRLLSHITKVYTTMTFSSAVASLGWPDRPSSSTLSPPS